MGTVVPENYDDYIDWNTISFSKVMIHEDGNVFHMTVLYSDGDWEFRVPVCRPREHPNKTKVPIGTAEFLDKEPCTLCIQRIAKLNRDREVDYLIERYSEPEEVGKT